MEEWVSAYETCDIEAPNIHRFLRVDELSTGPPGWGITALYQSLGMLLPKAYWAWVLETQLQYRA